MIAIDTPKLTGAPVPFGGAKQSGLGREGSRHGPDDHSELHYPCLGGLA
jgi:acyl-CoA reductase-like NAD-dependent aldehyde dehydrogenase